MALRDFITKVSIKWQGAYYKVVGNYNTLNLVKKVAAMFPATSVASSGDYTITYEDGTPSFIAAGNLKGNDLSMTESVTSPATSAGYTVKGKSVVHTCTAAATNTIAIDIPVGAKILGAQAIVSTALVFAGGGVSADLTWATSGQTVAATLAAKNTKGKAIFDVNDSTDKDIVSGSVEKMTLTPDAGTINVGGVVVVTAWYAELTDLTDVA